MDRKEILVNLIYVWRKFFGPTIASVFAIVTAPIWFIPATFYMLIEADVRNSDKAWCKENNYLYPYGDAHPHRKVKQFRKEKRRQRKQEKILEREIMKDNIRKEFGLK